MTKKRNEAITTILTPEDKDYFVEYNELKGRFVLMNPHTGDSFVGAAFPYTERDSRYAALVASIQDESFFSVDFMLEDMQTVVYFPSHIMKDMIVLVEALKPVSVH